MSARIVTIGQTVIACFKTELEMTAWRQCGEGPIDPRYMGEVGTAPHKKLAPLHPNFMRYYADALMVLWRGTHKLRGGTESAKRAFMDCLPQGTQYVIIWNPITHVNLVELKEHVDKLQRLLDKPEPGLSTWHEFVAQHLDRITEHWINGEKENNERPQTR